MDTATTEIYTLSLHDALPISRAGALPALPAPGARAARLSQGGEQRGSGRGAGQGPELVAAAALRHRPRPRSEEHTSELQSQSNLVCRLLLEKKKKKRIISIRT